MRIPVTISGSMSSMPLCKSMEANWRLTARLSCTGELEGQTVCLHLPYNLYEPLSGRAFKYWLEKSRVPLENTLTIVDDLSRFPSIVYAWGLPAGMPGITAQGYWGHHSEPTFTQNSVWIGNESTPKACRADFVLGKWKSEELPVVCGLKWKKSVEIIERICLHGHWNDHEPL